MAFDWKFGPGIVSVQLWTEMECNCPPLRLVVGPRRILVPWLLAQMSSDWHRIDIGLTLDWPSSRRFALDEIKDILSAVRHSTRSFKPMGLRARIGSQLAWPLPIYCFIGWLPEIGLARDWHCVSGLDYMQNHAPLKLVVCPHRVLVPWLLAQMSSDWMALTLDWLWVDWDWTERGVLVCATKTYVETTSLSQHFPQVYLKRLFGLMSIDEDRHWVCALFKSWS